MKLADYNLLKEKLDAKERAAVRAEQTLVLTMEDLHQGFGCASVAEARAKLEELEGVEARAKRKYEKALEAFQKKWGNELGL